MSDSEDISIDLSEEEKDFSTEDEVESNDSSDSEHDENESSGVDIVEQKTRTKSSAVRGDSNSSDGDQQQIIAHPPEQDEDRQPTQEERAKLRDENIRAMLDGSLDIHRKPLLPKLLSVTDAAAVLLKPFKSPHPNAPARSESLRRALAARKQFVPWGAGKPFQPPIRPPTHPDDDDGTATTTTVTTTTDPSVELPPGIEPLVLWEPPPGEEGNPVRVDDTLTRFLRPHQREGVQFMFECVTGLRNFDGHGCILADDMGLGKTLQGITLLWTLLNNGHPALGATPLARRIIICCPTSLVSNWDSECTKWLNGRVRTLPLCESSREDVIATINQFLSPRCPAQLLIVSYETFRLHAERFQSPDSCDLLICDEAHRLKNDQTLTNRALDSLACRRRVLLSGTPMQNQLQEFYSMVNFCNPGVLGTPAEFRKRYEAPILAGREPDASDAESTVGAERSKELSEIVNEFILRRTNSLLSAHLPPKVVEVVCCKMTPLQYDLYCHFVASRSVQNLFSTQKSARALSAITSLRKLLNHPKLIYDMVRQAGGVGGGRSGRGGGGAPSVSKKTEGSVAGFEGAGDLFPPGIFDTRGNGNVNGGANRTLPFGWEAMSGKFAVVARMLAILREQTKDRIVIVSNYTQTLDLFTSLCQQRGYPSLRLDGSTSINKRQKLVKKFNDPMDNQFVFLLSSKAGGCGLNLIGGNRLILFDMSWNPADDKRTLRFLLLCCIVLFSDTHTLTYSHVYWVAEAAARVWRDGQQRRVYVYRFMTTGTIEEKVYQRQLSKEGLQAVVDTKSSGDGGGAAVMTLEELRDLFSYDPDTLSTTYDHMVAQKHVPRKKKPDKVKNEKKNKKAAKKKKKKKYDSSSGSDEEEEIALVSDEDDDVDEDDCLGGGSGSGGGGVVMNGNSSHDGVETVAKGIEEEDDDNSNVVDVGKNQPCPTAPSGKALTSAALAAKLGHILKEQEGTPKEEDLERWGHHSDPTTVPDDCMRLCGGSDVTFVFSCQVEGREVPPDPPLVPLGQGKQQNHTASARINIARPHHTTNAAGKSALPPLPCRLPPPASKSTPATIPRVKAAAVATIEEEEEEETTAKAEEPSSSPPPPPPKQQQQQVPLQPIENATKTKVTGTKRPSPIDKKHPTHTLPSSVSAPANPGADGDTSLEKNKKKKKTTSKKNCTSPPISAPAPSLNPALSMMLYDSDDDFI